jgi:hypothetical protein
MRSEANTIRVKLTGGTISYMTNKTNSTNTNSSGEQREAIVKKRYKAPSFRFESAFEVSALTCGKMSATEGACLHSRKAS